MSTPLWITAAIRQAKAPYEHGDMVTVKTARICMIGDAPDKGGFFRAVTVDNYQLLLNLATRQQVLNGS